MFYMYNAFTGYTGLILPLLEEYPEVVDMESIHGTTCRHLLNKLVMLRQRSQPKVCQTLLARQSHLLKVTDYCCLSIRRRTFVSLL